MFLKVILLLPLLQDKLNSLLLASKYQVTQDSPLTLLQDSPLTLLQDSPLTLLQDSPLGFHYHTTKDHYYQYNNTLSTNTLSTNTLPLIYIKLKHLYRAIYTIIQEKLFRVRYQSVENYFRFVSTAPLLLDLTHYLHRSRWEVSRAQAYRFMDCYPTLEVLVVLICTMCCDLYHLFMIYTMSFDLSTTHDIYHLFMIYTKHMIYT